MKEIRARHGPGCGDLAVNGDQLIRELGLLASELPSLIVSGYAEAEDVDPKLLRLTRPFRKDELAAILAPLSARQS